LEVERKLRAAITGRDDHLLRKTIGFGSWPSGQLASRMIRTQARLIPMSAKPKLSTSTRKRAIENCEEALHQRIAFISTMRAVSWGGSEELWSRTALELMAQGFSVSASMREWSPPHPRIRNLAERGVEVWFRPAPRPLWKHAWRLFTAPTQTWKHAWRVFVEPQEAATTMEAGRLLIRK